MASKRAADHPLETVFGDGLKQVPFSNPIDVLEHTHHHHSCLCNMLEEIADSLPDDANPRQCGKACETLRQELPLHHRDEEEGLFPLLEMRARREDSVFVHLAQFRLEHVTDESHADELAHELDRLAEGQRPANPNMIGYMLRGFFECYRRHLYWENTLLLPLARRRLRDKDLQILFQTMTQHRATTPI